MNRLYAVETHADARPARAPIIGCRCEPSEIERDRARRSRRRVGVGRRRRRSADALPRDGSKWIAAVAKDLQAHRGREPRHRRRRPAAGRARARARDEPGARQRRADGRLHRPGRGRAGRSAAVAARSGRRHGRRQGRPAGHRRRQSGLHRAGRSAVRRRDGQGAAARPPQSRTTTRRRRCATGRFPRRTSSKPGATRAAYDGTVSIVQPLIAPLYGGRSAHELLAALSDRPERSGYDIVREYWNARRPATDDFDARAGAAGCTTASMPDTAFARANGRPCRAGALRRRSAAPAAGADRASRSRSATTRTVLDGRFANNGWLQELPKPITKLTWDNAVLVSPATAERLKASSSARRCRAASTARSSATSSSCAIEGRTVRGAAVPRGRPSRRLRHRASRLRPHARRPRRHRRRLQRQRDSHRPTRCGSAAASRSSPTGETLLAGVHAVSPPDGRARHGPRGHARRVRARSASRSTKATKRRRRR